MEECHWDGLIKKWNASSLLPSAARKNRAQGDWPRLPRGHHFYVSRRFTPLHCGTPRRIRQIIPTLLRTRTLRDSQALRGSLAQCGDVVVFRLPRLGSRVRIPLPAPFKIKYLAISFASLRGSIPVPGQHWESTCADFGGVSRKGDTNHPLDAEGKDCRGAARPPGRLQRIWRRRVHPTTEKF